MVHSLRAAKLALLRRNLRSCACVGYYRLCGVVPLLLDQRHGDMDV